VFIFIQNPPENKATPSDKPEKGFLDRRAGWRDLTEKALAFV
jgi:hypothetical protein